MKNWYLLMLILLSLIHMYGQISTETTKNRTPQSLAAYIYGPQGLNIPVTDYQNIESMLVTLDTLTAHEKASLLPTIVKQLESELEKINTTIKKQYSKQEKVPLIYFFNTFALQHQIIYLKELEKTLHQHEGFFVRIFDWMQHITTTTISWLESFFMKKTIIHHKEALVKKIIDYVNYEREHILFDYHKQLSFFTSIKKMPLPDIINFWNSENIQQQMYLRAEQVSEKIVTQFGLDTIVDLAIQGVLMAGGNMAIQWVDQSDEEVFENYEKKQNQIQQQWQTFMTSIQKQSQQVTTNILSHFKTALSGIQQEYTASNQLLQNEMQYLMRSLNIAQPKQMFLQAPINYDLAFEAAPMNTPASHIWYNIAQKGDWEYNADENNFWQNGLQPFGIPAWKTDTKTNKPGSDVPEFNSIFTEAIINGTEYTIEVECTIYTANFPFFIGVMFNKARWISGSPERLTGYRLFGLIGAESTTSPHTKTIDAAFAQQLIIPAQGSSPEKILSPLQIIDTEPAAHIASNILSSSDLATLSVEPMTFIFQINTSIESATCTILQQTIDASGAIDQKQIAQKTIEGLDKEVYLYHGIGFMAPGCQASFKLIKPIELVYTAEQTKIFKLPRQP